MDKDLAKEVENFVLQDEDFKKKMKPFINNYDMVPMVFIRGEFIGGHDDFIKGITNNLKKNNKKKNSLSVISNDIKKEETKLLRLLDALPKKNRSRKTA